MICYLDTSAAMKLARPEAESEALHESLFVTSERDVELVASWLLHTELHCAAHRHGGLLHAERIESLLDRVLLVDVSRGDLLTVAALGSGLRSQDAIHLTVALRLQCDGIVTYDLEMQQAARTLHLDVMAPA